MVRRVRKLDDGRLEAVTMPMNGTPMPLTFTLPAPVPDGVPVIDSAEPLAEVPPMGATIEVRDRAAMLIVGIGEVS